MSVPCGSLRFTRIGADWGEEQKVSVPSGSGSVTLATLTRAAHALGRKIKIDLVPAQHKIPRDDRTQKRHEGANSVCPLRFKQCLSPAVHDSGSTGLNRRFTRDAIRLGSWGEVSRTGRNWVANGSGLGYTII